jgi:diacylglycerol kinase family enzyme
MVFRTRVLPILEAGGLVCTVHETKHRGHATEIVKGLLPAECDVIVGVGGDGTVFEIVQV